MRNRKEVKDFFLAELGKITGSVLEIGFGSSCFFEKYSQAKKVVGIDFSEELIKETKLKLAKKNTSGEIDVYHSQAHKIPFEDNCFDFVVLSFCFCCLKNPQAVLAEIFRVGKSGAQIISFDHIRSTGILGLFLDLSTPFYAIMHKNCHLNRNPLIYYKEQNIQLIEKVKSNESFIPWLYAKGLIKK